MKTRYLLLIGGFLATCLAAPVIADVNYTQGTGTVIFDFLCFSTKHCSSHVPINSAGTEIFTSAAPAQVSLANTAANATAVKVDGSAVTQPVSLAANQSMNEAQINGVTPLMGNGVTGAGSQRVTIASDNTAFGVLATLQATATTAIGKVDPNTLGSWGLQVSTQNSATPTNGLLQLGQFNTTPTTISSGNVSPLQMDNAGNLLVNIKAGAGSGGTALADEATFTQGTTSMTPIGCLFINSYTALTTGKAGVVSCTSAGSLHTTVDNTLTALVNNADGIAAVSAVTGTAGNSPVNSTNYVFNGTTFDRQRSATQTGSTLIGSSDPCLGANKTNLPISQSGTSSVQLVGLSGSTVIYVCSLSLIAAGATTVVLTTGTGSACVTGNAAVIGDTTANIANGLSLAANGGLTLGNGAGTIAKGAASSELCMTLGTNVRMSGNLTYVQQ